MLDSGRFEAHITCNIIDAVEVRKAGEAEGWVFSQIAGCPILGPGTYCYLTSYDTNRIKLLLELERIAKKLREQKIEPLRLKIERIIYDTKTQVNEIGGD